MKQKWKKNKGSKLNIKHEKGFYMSEGTTMIIQVKQKHLQSKKDLKNYLHRRNFNIYVQLVNFSKIRKKYRSKTVTLHI